MSARHIWMSKPLRARLKWPRNMQVTQRKPQPDPPAFRCRCDRQPDGRAVAGIRSRAELDYINSVFAHNVAKLSLARVIGRAAEDFHGSAGSTAIKRFRRAPCPDDQSRSGIPRVLHATPRADRFASRSPPVEDAGYSHGRNRGRLASTMIGARQRARELALRDDDRGIAESHRSDCGTPVGRTQALRGALKPVDAGDEDIATTRFLARLSATPTNAHLKCMIDRLVRSHKKEDMEGFPQYQ